MILFIDCYDSFSYNLTRLIESACPGQEVVVVHNDKISAAQLASSLSFLEAIVIGPGPGDPRNPSDSGIISDLWGLVRSDPVPTFGVCFGYQSMVSAFGGTVEQMHPPQHGQIGKIEHENRSVIFNGIPACFNAVRYHSLHSKAQSPLICTAVDRITTPQDPIEMAAEHESLPFYGVQFHPESVLSTYGRQMFENFWTVARAFNRDNRKIVQGAIPTSLKVTQRPLIDASVEPEPRSPDLVVQQVPSTAWTKVVSALKDVVIMKSASSPGEWSIIGLLEPGITPHIRCKNDVILEGPLYGEPSKTAKATSFWEYAANFMQTRLLSIEQALEINKDANVPFLGGLTGYISYEGGCQHTVNKGEAHGDSNLNSDFSLVFITKCVIINENTGRTYAVGTGDWVNSVPEILAGTCASSGPRKPGQLRAEVSRVAAGPYEEKFHKCYEKLQTGDSYELCLTTQAKLQLETPIDPLSLFLHLVERNPAPYCSYMAFDDVLISTSPERFMAWDFESCEFRPIKGTVRKGPGMTRAKAEEILRTPKEQAENLMIVDLIRHDLNHLLEDVTTPQLMTVEEYYSVFQLVTSVKGKLRRAAGKVASPSGIDVLSQSLPPGSMTGAPKQRSVEILRDIETQPRGIYSGVHGFWSIDDRGDWSVVIRSLFRSKTDDPSMWRLGAGGAVTVLSTAEQEYEEMITKMDTVLNAFET